MKILKIIDLSRFFGGVKALQNMTTDIEENSITALIGPNGAGKTTAFNLITGILPLTSGKVIFCGKDITGKPPHKIAYTGISRTFQNVRIFSNMTVLENVMMGLHTRTKSGILSSALKLRRTKKEESYIRDEAAKCLEFMELGWAIDMNAGSLAFGQQRILEIARALAMKPKLLLLDEPAAGLNSQETLKLGETINKIQKTGVTVFIVEHDMELVMSISHSIVVLNNGRLIASGTPSEIQRDQEVITAYLGEE